MEVKNKCVFDDNVLVSVVFEFVENSGDGSASFSGMTASNAFENILKAYSNSSLTFTGSNLSMIWSVLFLSMPLKNEIAST